MDKPKRLLSRSELHEAIRKQSQERERRLDRRFKEARKPRWFFPERHAREPSQPTVARIAEEPSQPEWHMRPLRRGEATCLPDEPIHHCEVDEATGEYYCPFCSFQDNPVAEDPWEAMFHEVAHFEPEEAAAMRREYEERTRDYDAEQSQPPQTPQASAEADSRRRVENAVPEHGSERDTKTDGREHVSSGWLSRTRKIILAGGISLIIFTGLYSPWRAVTHGPYGVSSSQYVGRAFSPPEAKGWAGLPASADVDLRELLLDWALIAFGTAGALFLVGKQPR